MCVMFTEIRRRAVDESTQENSHGYLKINKAKSRINVKSLNVKKDLQFLLRLLFINASIRVTVLTNVRKKRVIKVSLIPAISANMCEFIPNHFHVQWNAERNSLGSRKLPSMSRKGIAVWVESKYMYLNDLLQYS